jgi:hypothetical protein
MSNCLLLLIHQVERVQPTFQTFSFSQSLQSQPVLQVPQEPQALQVPQAQSEPQAIQGQRVR